MDLDGFSAKLCNPVSIANPSYDLASKCTTFVLTPNQAAPGLFVTEIFMSALNIDHRYFFLFITLRLWASTVWISIRFHRSSRPYTVSSSCSVARPDETAAAMVRGTLR